MTRAPRRRAARAQQGVSGLLLLAALTVLGGIGVWATGLAGASGDTVAQASASARAQEAAAGGIEWTRWRLRVPATASCTAVQNVVLPGTLGGVTVTTRCSLVGSYAEAGVTVRRWRVTADACNQPMVGLCPSAAPAAGYVQASRSALVERP